MTTPCAVLEEDPGLAEALTGQRLARARAECLAVETVVEQGPWAPEREGEAVRGGIGLLILDGLVVRRVGHDGRYGAELLGPGDLMRPWQQDGEDSTLPFETSFRVGERLRLALLDLRFAARLAAFPEVSAALVGRAMHRARSLAVNMAITHYPRVDQRLLLLLWHLADRWGRVTPEGVRIPLRLSHSLLADLVASRRPSVTTAMGQLEREGRMGRDGRAVVLYGGPPSELYEAREVAEREP